GARAAHHDAGKAPCPGISELNDTNINVALLEDPVVGQKLLEVVADAEKRTAKGLDVVDQLLGQVLVNTADPEEGRMHAAARGALVERHQLFALLKSPQRRRERAHVQGLSGDVEDMR